MRTRIFTEAQRTELDKQRSALVGRGQACGARDRADRGGAYNVCSSKLKQHRCAHNDDCCPPRAWDSGADTEARKNWPRPEAGISSRPVQANETCRTSGAVTVEVDRGLAAARRVSIIATSGGMNRHAGPEDGACRTRLTAGLDRILRNRDAGGFSRIVQTPGGISMFYGRGSGARMAAEHRHERKSHVPAKKPPVDGDSRGHWRDNTL